ncbi:MAG: hypothetical protein KBG22_13460 [Smithella sp.]|nr:hypothetical protein [Smithella sp.]MDM7986729.1 hypothetical protein [Smithella sp.]HQI73411.1 hypothetical protein [Smithella sp.]
MSSDFSLEFKGKYIHIIHAPDYEISQESNKRLWMALAEACREYKCLKVLAEGSTQKRKVTSMDAYESGAQAAESIPGLKLAICIYEYTPDETTEFFKNVAYNRGVRIEFFKDKKKALDWLGIKDAE